MEDLSIYNPEGSSHRKAQMRMVSILDVFVELCEKHKIDYWLEFGTTLGARRHNGFIPWDDDVDVSVLQKDYKKLLRILETELPPNLKLQTKKTDKNYTNYFAKIRDLNSVFYEYGSEKYKYKGIFIDIFSIEQVPTITFKKVIDSVLNSPNSISTTKVFLGKLKYLLMILLMPLIKLLIFISRWYYKNKTTGIFVYSFGWRYYGEVKLSYFYPIGKMKFEGKKYNVPGDIDGYLAFRYGNDFMTLPPKDKRRVHSGKIEIF